MARFPLNSTPKLTEETISVITDAIRRGAYVETAAALAGISKDTFYRWLKMRASDEADDLMLQKLSDAVQQAMAEAEMRDLDIIDRAANEGAWKAAAWRLERKYPSRWGRRQNPSHDSGGDPFFVQQSSFTRMTEEQYQMEMDKLQDALTYLPIKDSK